MNKILYWIRKRIFKKTVDSYKEEVKNLRKSWNGLKNSIDDAKEVIENPNPDPIGYQITDYDGKSKVYSQRHLFKTFLDAMYFADNNNFLCGFEVRPVFAKDVVDPIFIDSCVCR